MMITAWQNRAKNLTMGQASTIVKALQMQSAEFYAAWPELEPFIPLLFQSQDDSQLPEGCFPCVFVDNPDIAGALGYHSVTAGGRYYARIFVDLLLKEGPWNESVSACASHEQWELALNPTCLLGVPGPALPQGSRYQKEASDPVQSDSYVKQVSQASGITPVRVSNFVLPSYFDRSTPAGTKVDYLGTCPGPFLTAPGGYMLVSKDGLEAPSPVFDPRRPPSAACLARKALGHRFFGGLTSK